MFRRYLVTIWLVLSLLGALLAWPQRANGAGAAYPVLPPVPTVLPYPVLEQPLRVPPYPVPPNRGWMWTGLMEPIELRVPMAQADAMEYLTALPADREQELWGAKIAIRDFKLCGRVE